MLRIITKMFIVVLSSIVHASNHTKCISLSKKKFEIRSTLINLHPNEYRQEFHFYPFAVKLDRYVGSCNTLNDLSNKTEDLNLSRLNMITGINESETLTKHIPCECKCKFGRRKCNSDQLWNNYKCRCDFKNHSVCICKRCLESFFL